MAAAEAEREVEGSGAERWVVMEVRALEMRAAWEWREGLGRGERRIG